MSLSDRTCNAAMQQLTGEGRRYLLSGTPNLRNEGVSLINLSKDYNLNGTLPNLYMNHEDWEVGHQPLVAEKLRMNARGLRPESSLKTQ